MRFWFTLLMSLLIMTNFLAIYNLDHQSDRWFRFGATLILAGLFLRNYLSNYRLLLVFLLLVLCDGLLVYYEIPILKKIVYVSRILAYLFLILLVSQYLQKLKLNVVTIVIATATIALDLYLLNDMAGSLPEADRDPWFLILFYTLGMISLAVVAVSISFLNRYANKQSLYLVLVTIGFVLSDIFYYNAYYLEFDVFYYFDRFCNICALGALVLLAREIKFAKNKFQLKPGEF
ncbi:hypothetical protein [Christiangramia sabulilitoris]|uniref:YhhN-like protein n=1 Tax=Christiangramia sabulilitoris TaxID=2583991 RepID=A0A550HZ31_9FLAO|nr:hypothetical protein [Christiangramia sabulilitoris]TRO63994.1 hypothetical protein FGM01_10820 [Christiangramia sabulilitoris]